MSTDSEQKQFNPPINLDKENILNGPVVVAPKKSTRYSNWPLKDVKEPHDNDVLYGRGGGTNHHPGNKRYRKLVESRKCDYVNSKRLDKPLVALEIIREWRGQDPPGRFLKLDDESGLWHDVGDKKAREKTSQALREKAPQVKKQQYEERKEVYSTIRHDNIPREPKEGTPKNTRFQIPEQPKSNTNVSRPFLARDHSLGRDYIQDDKSLSVKGFSWDTEVLKTTGNVSDKGQHACSSIPEDCVDDWVRSSPGSKNGPITITAFAIRGSGTCRTPVNIQRTPSEEFEGPGAIYSDLLNGDNPIDAGENEYPSSPSRHSFDWPHPQNSHTPRSHYKNENLQSMGNGRNEETHQTYPFNTRELTYDIKKYSKGSLLKRSDFSKLADIVSQDHGSTYEQIPTQLSNDGRHDRNDEWSVRGGIYPNYITPNPPCWTQKSHATEASTWEKSKKNTYHTKKSRGNTSGKVEKFRRREISDCLTHHADQNIPKPNTVKRETSHQNENIETKPQIKRLNRQRSVEFVSEGDVNNLGSSLMESTLDTPKLRKKFSSQLTRPSSLTEENRTSTIDVILNDMEKRTSSEFVDLEDFTEPLISSSSVNDFPSEPSIDFRSKRHDEYVQKYRGIITGNQENLIAPDDGVEGDRLATNSWTLFI